MDKQLDLEKNLQELCGEYPELIGILAEVGLGDFVKESALKTISRMMTITKGAWIKNLDMMLITATLRNHGFSLTGSAMTDLGLDLTGDDILDADPLTEWDPSGGKVFSWGDEEEEKSPEIETCPFSSLPPEQLDAMFLALPVDLTFYDAAGEKQYCSCFRKEEDLSDSDHADRSASGITAADPLSDRTDVETLQGIREDFLAGKRTSADVWSETDGEPVLDRYLAVHDEQGTYIGMLRWRQGLGFARQHLHA